MRCDYLLLVIASGCGRVNFDAVSVPGDAPSTTDGITGDGIATAPTHRQATNATVGGAATLDASFSALSANGDTIAVAVSWDGAATLTDVTDSMNNSYTLVGSVLTGLGSNAQTAFATNIAGGTLTVTAHLSASSTGVSLVVDDLAGVDPVNAIVSANAQFQPANPSPDALSTGALVLSGSNDYVFGASFNVTGNDAVYTNGTGFTVTTSGARGSAPFMCEFGIEREPATFTEDLSVGDYMTLGMVFRPEP